MRPLSQADDIHLLCGRCGFADSAAHFAPGLGGYEYRCSWCYETHDIFVWLTDDTHSYSEDE